MEYSEKKRELINSFPELIRCNVQLSGHTWFKIGGPADLFCTPSNSSELIELLKAARELDVPHVLIGDGSNLLVDDAGFRGMIIRFRSGSKPAVDDSQLTAEGGILLSDVLKCAAENSLSGMENLAGIPGTTGGAVFMNAGAYGTSISDLLVRARVLTGDLETREVSPEYFRFMYRWSELQQSSDILLDATFKLEKGDRSEIEKGYERIKADRAAKHPGDGFYCAGSYFKNLPPEEKGGRRRAAGMFLDRAGAKEFTAGGASVFHKHANMIVNRGEATAEDVLTLAEKMKLAAKDSFGIILEEEVRYLDSERGIIERLKP